MSKQVVRDLMTNKVAVLTGASSANEALQLMDERHIRHVPVVTDDFELVGLVSHRDLLKHVLAATDGLPGPIRDDILDSIKLDQIMTIVPETVSPEQPLAEAAQMLIEYKFGCLPVVEGVRLVGILTETDFVRRFLEL